MIVETLMCEDTDIMMSKHELVGSVEECWRTMRQQVEGIDLSTPIYPDPLWTVRDVLVHCAFWNDEAAKSIEAHLNGGEYATDTGAAFSDGLDQMNARVIEASRSLSEAEVRQVWIAAQDDLTEAVRSIDDAAMSREITCPWHERKPVPEMVQDELGHETGHINDVLMAVSAQGDAG